jgi:uncharacterized protein
MFESGFTGWFSVIRDFATVIGEEIGWRGFLVPELVKRHSLPATAIISGFIWAIWHYPVLLFADYHSPVPAWYYVPLLTAMLPFLTFVWALDATEIGEHLALRILARFA